MDTTVLDPTRACGSSADGGEDILTRDVADDALERAAGGADGRTTTWAYCTKVWYNCGWPM